MRERADIFRAVLTPLRGFCSRVLAPTASAVGYRLTPLRGCGGTSRTLLRWPDSIDGWHATPLTKMTSYIDKASENHGDFATLLMRALATIKDAVFRPFLSFSRHFVNGVGWHGQRYSDARVFGRRRKHGHASTPAHATHYFGIVGLLRAGAASRTLPIRGQCPAYFCRLRTACAVGYRLTSLRGCGRGEFWRGEEQR